MHEETLQDPSRSAMAFKIRDFNLALTSPNLKTESFVRSFNQTVRNEFFVSAQRSSFQTRSSAVMNLQEFPANTLLRNYFAQKKDNFNYGSASSKKQKKDMLEDKKGHPYIDWQLTKTSRQSQKALKSSINYQRSYLVSPKSMRQSKKGKPYQKIEPRYSIDTNRVSAKGIPKFTTDRQDGSFQQSNPSVDKKNENTKFKDYFDILDGTEKDTKKENQLDLEYSFGMGKVRRVNSQSPEPVESNQKCKMGSPEIEKKSIQIREVVKVLNKKLDSFRGHGNGSALVRNLLRNMNQQAGTLGLIENRDNLGMRKIFSIKTKGGSPSNKKLTESKPTESQFSTRLSNIKIESRDHAFRSSEHSIKQILKNKKHLPKFDKPKVVLNVDELLDSPSKRIIDNGLVSGRRNKTFNFFSPDKYQASNLVFADVYPQDFANYPPTLKQRIIDLLEDRSLKSQRSLQGFNNKIPSASGF